MTTALTPTTNPVVQKRLRLRKACKLRHLAMVNYLFTAGAHKEIAYPVRMMWRLIPPKTVGEFFHDTTPPHFGPMQFLITIPKKQLHHAVDRVLMRRRIREAIRLNQQLLETVIPTTHQGVLALAFIYMAPKTKSYASVEKAVCKLLNHVATTLSMPTNTDTNPPGHEQEDA